jgi:hypothetical protein
VKRRKGPLSFADYIAGRGSAAERRKLRELLREVMDKFSRRMGEQSRIVAKGARHAIAALARLALHQYKQTNNPLYLWQCYAYGREAGKVPNEVLRYLDRCAQRLMEKPESEKVNFERELARALEFKKLGRGSFTARFQRDRQEMEMAARLLDMKAQGKSDFACRNELSIGPRAFSRVRGFAKLLKIPLTDL